VRAIRTIEKLRKKQSEKEDTDRRTRREGEGAGKRRKVTVLQPEASKNKPVSYARVVASYQFNRLPDEWTDRLS